jgi:FtsZ-interacting cell division protein ZipA
MSTDQPENNQNTAVVDAALANIQTYQDKKSNGKNGWIFGGIAAILSIVAIGLIYFRLWRTGKELAKLKHERDVYREKETQAITNSAIATNNAEKTIAMRVAQEAQVEQTRIAEEIKQLQIDTNEKHKIINSLTTWEDVDKYIQR